MSIFETDYRRHPAAWPRDRPKMKILCSTRIAVIKLIVGLGNPGHLYENTRHNVGAWFVQRLAALQQTHLKTENKFSAAIAQSTMNRKMFWLAVPNTFMNESGRAVGAIAKFYKISPAQILIAHDELDFPAGIIKIKEGGGHGGHNGLRDIMVHLQTRDFWRLRIGIGHPGHKDKVTPYVLNAPSSVDKTKIVEAIEQGCAIVPDFLQGDHQKAFRFLHGDMNGL